MGEWACVHRAVVRPCRVDLGGELRCHEVEVEVGDHRAFRAAGRAGGVEEPREGVRVSLDEIGRRGGGDRLAVGDRTGVAAATHSDEARRRPVDVERRDTVVVRLMEDEGAAAALLEDVAVLLGVEALLIGTTTHPAARVP